VHLKMSPQDLINTYTINKSSGLADVTWQAHASAEGASLSALAGDDDTTMNCQPSLSSLNLDNGCPGRDVLSQDSF